MMLSTSNIAAVLALSGATSAHMIMANPKPIRNGGPLWYVTGPAAELWPVPDAHPPAKGNEYHFINCQLHVALSPAADYGSPASPYQELALSRKLPAQSTQEEVAKFGFDLYWEVLAPFSDIIVLFVAGIGSLRTAAVLQRWAQISLTVSRFGPYILVVTEDTVDPRLEEFLDTFARNPGGGIRVSTLICGLGAASATSSLAEQSNEARIKLELNFAYRYRSFLI
jgi:hypothetical protein